MIEASVRIGKPEAARTILAKAVGKRTESIGIALKIQEVTLLVQGSVHFQSGLWLRPSSSRKKVRMASSPRECARKAHSPIIRGPGSLPQSQRATRYLSWTPGAFPRHAHGLSQRATPRLTEATSRPWANRLCTKTMPGNGTPAFCFVTF